MLYERATQKVFGETGGTGEFGRIGSDAAGSPVTTKDPASIQALTQYLQGLFAITDSLSEPPRGQDINALYYLITRQLANLFQDGNPQWDSATEYFADRSFAVGSDGNLYRSVTGTDGSPNLNHDPVGDDGTYWVSGEEALRQIKSSIESVQDNDIETLIAMRKHDVGEPVYNLLLKTASQTFPAVRIDDADHDIAVANWPELVPALRDEQLAVLGSSSFTGTVAGSVITLASTTAGDALLAALVEDAKVHGGDGETENYTNGRSINVAGTDYAITAINVGSRTITVSGTPTTGSQTVLLFPHRIAGSTTTARLYKVAGRSIISNGDSDGFHLSGLRNRDFMQKITGSFTRSLGVGSLAGSGVTSGAFSPGPSLANSSAGEVGAAGKSVNFDSSTSTGARAGDRTINRGMSAYLYVWGGRYVSP